MSKSTDWSNLRPYGTAYRDGTEKDDGPLELTEDLWKEAEEVASKMPDERFMRHHYGASGYVPSDSPLTPWGEALARIQNMTTEGYCNISLQAKDDIRQVYHRLLDLTREAACPCCHAGTTITLEPCQECHGKGLAIVAYDTLRIHYKSLQEYADNLKDALSYALDCVEVTRNWLAADSGEGCADAAKACDEVLAYAEGLGVKPTSKLAVASPNVATR